MSVADLHDLELIWPSSRPKDVIVTGTFDQWSSSIRLVKGDTGFSGTAKVPWGQKVAYKFIVDGIWKCRDDRPQEDDGLGNINNVLRTPEKPQAVFPTVAVPPAHLSIPLEGAQSQGYGDIETMVTAVEFLPPAEHAVARGSLSTIPQTTVEGFGLAPPAGTPVSVSKLDTAAATEGSVFPASEAFAGLVSSKQALSSSNVTVPPINDNSSDPIPPVNGNRMAHESDSFGIHAPIQVTKGDPPTSPRVPEAAKEAVFAPLESAAPQLIRSPQAAQDITPASTPAMVLEPITKQPGVDLEVRGHRSQATTTASIGSASTPASSTLTHKKRRSLFAKIKHIFDKDDKREKKEKNNH